MVLYHHYYYYSTTMPLLAFFPVPWPLPHPSYSQLSTPLPPPPPHTSPPHKPTNACHHPCHPSILTVAHSTETEVDHVRFSSSYKAMQFDPEVRGASCGEGMMQDALQHLNK